mmetsp:Transcript_29843/g.45224  ORF Transcript_29843/g.45224 Transcript_29843/m.45224 type:complete len:155 (+) Transcript_29843:82-546(+)
MNDIFNKMNVIIIYMLFFIIQGIESFVIVSSPTATTSAFVRVGSDYISRSSKTPLHMSSPLSSIDSSLQLADDKVDTAINVIGNSVLVYPLGLLALSLVAYALTFVAEKILVDEDATTEFSDKSDTTKDNNKKPEPAPEPEPLVVENRDEQWLD